MPSDRPARDAAGEIDQAERQLREIAAAAARIGRAGLLERDIAAARRHLESIVEERRALVTEAAAYEAELAGIRASEAVRITELVRRGRAALTGGRPAAAAAAYSYLPPLTREPACGGPPPLGPGGSRPTVSVLVLNLNGRRHLETCLPSLHDQTYAAEAFEVVVVDNGSTDGSLELVRDRFPRVRTIAYAQNRGFAEAYNLAVERCQADCVVFLNNDTRVERSWIAELVAAAERHSAAGVASKMLDWEGGRIDFAGGIVSCVGHCWQRDAGGPAGASYNEDRLLFACGGSMLVRRQVFLDAGGFDPDFFAYFEDVDLGWRLSLLGHDTVFAPSAVTYHRVHGTAGRWPMATRLRLYERNALMMIYKNYEDATLARVLPVAVTLAVARACAHAGIDPHAFDFGRGVPSRIGLSPRTIAHLVGLEDFALALPLLAEKRRAIQRRRQRSDAELLPLFGDPLRLHEVSPVYERTARALIAAFGIDRWVASGPGMSAPPSLPVAVRAAARDEGPVPRVSIVILVAAGPVHLPDCLDSIRALDYPPDRLEVIVVDNGSPRDPTEVAGKHYPGVRVIRNGRNLGFAAGNNVGLRASTGSYVVFLNDDTRVAPDWLAELINTARRRGAACVASRILTWDGSRIDFISGTMNLEGRGFHARHGSPAGDGDVEQAIFFPNGAAVMIDRERFLESGGWDEATFAYYEDVELGWRMWLLGEEVWSAPRSVVFHKHHGTSGQSVEAPRVRLYERNALRMLFTHLERGHLERVLPAALLLAADRVLLQTGLGRSRVRGRSASRLRRLWQVGRGMPWQFRRALMARGAGRHLSFSGNLQRVGMRGILVSARDVVQDGVRHARSAASHPRGDYFIESGSTGAALEGRLEMAPAGAAAALAGVQEFLASLPELEQRRQWLQAHRRRSDQDILGRFNTSWLHFTPAAHPLEHRDLHDILVHTLHLGAIAGTTPPAARRPRRPRADRRALGGYPSSQHESTPDDPVLRDARKAIDALLDEAEGGLKAVQDRHEELRETIDDLSESRLRRGLVGAIESVWSLVRVLRVPFDLLGAGIASLEVPGLRLIGRGYERVGRIRVQLRAAHAVAHDTDGQPPDAIRWLGPLSIGGVERDALYCHPRASIEFSVAGWSGGKVVAWFSLMPEAWEKNRKGVRFTMFVRSAGGTAVKTRWLTVPPFGRPRWYRLVLRVPDVEAGEVRVRLLTEAPEHGSACSFAVWGDPSLERARPFRENLRAFRKAVGMLGPAGLVRRLVQLGSLTDDTSTYGRWVAANAPTAADLQAMQAHVPALKYRPTISVITPVYNTNPAWLRACIDSVRRQVYPHWELCLCDDGSTSDATRAALREAEGDPRIRVTWLEQNRGISGASNAALESASGEFVALLDHDDELTPDALYQVASFLNDHPDADLIYSDEDKLDQSGQRCDPYFKPDWSPEHFLTCMYACHLLVIRRTIMRAAGAFRVGYEGSQDFDAVLRVMQRTPRIFHLPRILYHWRKIEGSAAGSGMAKPWALDAGRRAIDDYAVTTNLEADIETGPSPGQYRVRHRLRGQPGVSIVLAGAARRTLSPAGTQTVLGCLRAMERTDYGRLDVVVVDDGSLSGEERARLQTGRARVVTCSRTGGMTLAEAVNFGVGQTDGEHVVICCDLVEPRSPGWLRAMLEYSQQAAIGAVGAKLLYPDGRLRHVGVILGVGGVAALPFHGFPASFPGYLSSAVGVRNYSAVSGSCLMTRRDVFDSTGGFRNEFGPGFTDLDYCLRLRSAGYRVVFTPYAELDYLGPDEGASIQGAPEHIEAMRRSWGKVLKNDPFYNPNLTREYFDLRPHVEDARPSR